MTGDVPDEAIYEQGDLVRVPTQEWARLYLVPGMAHCRGGEGLDQFDMLSKLVNWVENGNAPGRGRCDRSGFPRPRTAAVSLSDLRPLYGRRRPAIGDQLRVSPVRR
nr:tannase/feruloyl esterase family alpha/beta hydrolase [Chelativorans xinjiangense]